MKLSDKDFEQKLMVMKEILEFKFKIPPNIYQSIFHAMSSLLVSKVDVSKDFLVMKILDVIEALCES